VLNDRGRQRRNTLSAAATWKAEVERALFSQ
jgi:hypothetical protein